MLFRSTAYDAEPGSDWAPPAPAKKERRAYKDLVKWQHCFRDNCSVHRCEKVDAGYYPRIVGKDGVLSKQDETHRKRRRTMRTRQEGEGGEKTSSDVEHLGEGDLGTPGTTDPRSRNSGLKIPTTYQAR